MPLAKPIRKRRTRTTTSGTISSTEGYNKSLSSSKNADKARNKFRSKAKDRTVKIRCNIFHSTAIICEFLYYSFNTILGLRKVYHDYDFKYEKRYEIFLPLLIDNELKNYLKKVTTQLKPWLEVGKVSRVALAIISKETRETVERWQFEIKPTATGSSNTPNDNESQGQNQSQQNPSSLESSRSSLRDLRNDNNREGDINVLNQPDGDNKNNQPENTSNAKAVIPRSDHDMQAEALQIFRQIFSSVTFMPNLEPDQYLFTILSYIDKDSDVPIGWSLSDPHLISSNSPQVPIHGLTTSVHKLKTTVTYCDNNKDNGDEDEDDDSEGED